MKRLLFVLLLLLASDVEAKDFCVNSSTGSDGTSYASLNMSTCTASVRRAADVAQAGDHVYVAAGTYNAAGTGNRFISSLNPSNSGFSGNPIVFEAVGTVNLGLSSSTGPILGCSSRDYITWIGFSVDEANGTSTSDTGSTVGHDSTGCRFEAMTIDGNGTGHNRGDNHTGIRFEDCTDCYAGHNTIHDVYTCAPGACSFGDIAVNGHNGACILTYGSENLTIEHNELYNCGAGIFIKGGPSGGWTSDIDGHQIRFNLIHDVTLSGIAYYVGGPADSATPSIISQNIVYSATTCFRYWFFNSTLQDPKYTHYINNTCYNADYGFEYRGTPAAFSHNLKVWNNVVSGVTNAVLSQQLTFHQSSAENSHEHNVYHNVSGTMMLLDDGSESVTLANWKLSPYTQDAASPDAITTDPSFVDAGSGDFHLSGGSAALSHGRVTNSIGGSDGSTIPAGAYITGSETIGPDAGGATVPDAPTIGTATAGNTQCSVAFTPPGDDGGATITGYTATSSPGSITGTGASSPITVTGLSNGTGYTFTVYATNSEGNSSNSSASNTCTPFASAVGKRIRLRGE